MSNHSPITPPPEPEGPTDDRIMDVARKADLVYYMGQGLGFASPYMEGADITEEVLAFAHAVLARWGRSTPQPPADGEVAEGPKPVVDYSRVPEIATEAQIRSAAQYLVKKRNCDGDLIPAIEYAIARWGLPTPPVVMPVFSNDAQVIEPPKTTLLVPYFSRPVPVSERLPVAEHCNADGEIWAWRRFDPEGDMDNGDHWMLAFHEWLEDEDCGFTHWLPAHALPVPTSEND